MQDGKDNEVAKTTLETVEESVSVTVTEPQVEENVQTAKELAITPMPYIPSTVLQSSNDFAVLEQTVQALASMQSLAKILIKSNLCPLKKEEDVILAIITGNQYNLPFMTSINNIVAINNKPSLSAHLHRALILQHGLIFEKIYDFEPMYSWAKTDEAGKVLKYATKLPNGQATESPIILGTFTKQDKPKEHCVAAPTEVDRITRYKFTRQVKQANGQYRELIVITEFKMSDAVKAGLTEKDVWVKYSPDMLDARAFVKGARQIGSDITLGIMSISEMAEAMNLKYRVNSNLEEELIYD